MHDTSLLNALSIYTFIYENFALLLALVIVAAGGVVWLIKRKK
jgi:hypothetical protein